MNYLLDIETLLLFLSNRKQSGELSTTLKRFPGVVSKTPCRVLIVLNEGNVVSYAIHDTAGNVLASRSSIFAELQKMGQLDWTWLPTRPVSAPVLKPPIPQAPAHPFGLVPRRIVPLEKINRNAFPRRHWQVLILVDGIHSVAQIASLLIPSPSIADVQTILLILKELQRQGIVTVDE